MIWVYKAEISSFTALIKFVRPYPKLPNVSSFEIEKLAKFHPILKLGGILKRMRKAVFSTGSYTNRPMNRYVDYMFDQLRANTGNPRVFFKLVPILMERSVAFRLCCIRKIFKTWYKDYSLKFMFRLLSDYNNLNLKKFTYKRVNILKANGKIRSLGVPTPAWRVYQTGLNMILLVWLSTYQHPSQHGFIPGKGTDTAWKQIISEVLPAKYIYEIDLREFFDRVNLDYLSKTLKKLEIPDEMVHNLIAWSRVAPAIVQQKKLNSETKKLPLQKWKGNKINETNSNIFFEKDLRWQSATDLTWLKPKDRLDDLHQHYSIPFKERKYYKDFRHEK